MIWMVKRTGLKLRMAFFLRSLQLPDGVLRPFELSVWDTSIAMLALQAGGVSACDASLQPTINWLVSTQSPGGLDLSESVPGMVV